MLHELFASWMHLTLEWGYPGVFLMMAIESTVFPLPSEVIVPPAAYWAKLGHLSFWGVVLASTLGSWFGSAVSYLVARRLGRPLIIQYGRYFFLPEKKWELAERWINHFGAVGIFFARLLPVVRHLVSLPAGAARMNFTTFSVSTLLGSFLWSWVLAWFGAEVLGSQPGLLEDPAALTHVLKDKLIWFVAAAVVLFGLYVAVDVIGQRLKAKGAVAAKAP